MDFKKKMNHRLTIAVVYILMGAVLVCIDLVNTTENYFYFAFGFALLLMGALRLFRYQKSQKVTIP